MLHAGVIYRHIILTVPAMFRTTFYQYTALIDYYGLRCQIELNFRDAKRYWGLEDFRRFPAKILPPRFPPP